MLLTSVILAVASLSSTASGKLSRLERQTTPERLVVPDFKSTFNKDGVPAKWAPGHPKAWSTADASYQYNVTTSSNTDFNVAVTHDEKYVAIWDGYRVHFTDLDTKAKVAAIIFNLPRISYSSNGLSLRPVAIGGWDILVQQMDRTLRQRVSASLQPVGTQNTFDGPFSGAITADGTLIDDHGRIYDLENTGGNNGPETQLTASDHPDYSGDVYIVSPDGVHLGLKQWDGPVKLLSAATGEAVATLDAIGGYGDAAFDFSPDGKYIAVLTVTDRDQPNPTKLRVWEVANPSAPPVEVTASLQAGRAGGGAGASVKWSSSGKQIAVLDENRAQVFDFPGSKEITSQTWAAVSDSMASIPNNLQWHDGGKKMSWWWKQGQYLYDLESNLLYLWTPSTKDRAWKDSGFMYLEKRGVAVTANGDATVRLWKV